jgi:hypothetical protein
MKRAAKTTSPKGKLSKAVKPRVGKRKATKKKSERHDFYAPTRRVIAERGGYRCAHPSCGAPTVGPALVDKGGTARIGMAAHIHAASPEGPRYKKRQTEAQRRSAENGLWMCQSCGTVIDSDDSGHTAEELREWKEVAELRAKAELGLASNPALFRLRHGDQTTYINLPRFHEMAKAKGFNVNNLPSSNRPLLESEGRLAAIVLTLEGVLERMKPEAIPITNIKNKNQCEAVVGKLVSFKGRFRSSKAPRIRDHGIPEYHPSGDINRDHVIKKTFGAIQLVLPLDSFWYASQSSVGFFRAQGHIGVHGISSST